jgi:hypothetical protein
MAEVTQADRETAWIIARFFLGNSGSFPDELRDGRIERHFLLDVLAKHRTATGDWLPASPSAKS